MYTRYLIWKKVPIGTIERNSIMFEEVPVLEFLIRAGETSIINGGRFDRDEVTYVIVV